MTDLPHHHGIVKVSQSDCGNCTYSQTAVEKPTAQLCPPVRLSLYWGRTYLSDTSVQPA